MRRLQKKHLPLITGVLFLGLLLYTLGHYLFSTRFASEHEIWPGYLTVLVGNSASWKQIYVGLNHSGLTYVSPATTKVSINDFSSTENVPLAEIGQRLDPMDPRLDPYIRGLSRYFSADGHGMTWHVVYVEAKCNTLITAIAVRRALRSTHARISFADIDVLRLVLAFSLFALVTAFLFQRYVGDKRFLLIASVPLVIQAVHGGYFGFTSSVLLLSSWWLVSGEWQSTLKYFLDYRVWRPRATELTETLFVLVGAALASLLLAATGPKAGLLLRMLGLSLLSIVAVFGMQTSWSLYRHMQQEHRIFAPLSLLGRRYASTAHGLRMLHPAFVIIICVVPLLLPFLPSGSDPAAVPRPERLAGVNDYSWQSLSRLASYRNSEQLPGLAQYVTHCAFQDALMVSLRYAFPQPGEKVDLSSYSESHGKIVKSEKAYVVYDQKWYRRIMQDAANQGLTRMLMRESAPTAVTSRPQPQTSVDALLLLRHLFLFLLLYAPLLLFYGNLTPQIIYGMRRLQLRKRRQTA